MTLKVQEVAESAFWRQPHNRKTLASPSCIASQDPFAGGSFLHFRHPAIGLAPHCGFGGGSSFGKCLQSPVWKIPWQFRTAMQSLAWENEILVFNASDPVQAGPTETQHESGFRKAMA